MKMPRLVWLLIIGMAVNVTGASFIWPLNTIYIHNELGKSLSVAGIVLMLNSGASVAGNLMGGKMFDRFGGYLTVMTGILLAMISLVGMVLIHTWPWYPVWLILVGFGSGIVFPAIYAMAGVAWPEGGRRTFNAIYLAQNLGVAIGAAAGGFMADISFNLIFIANLLLFVVFFFIAIFGYREAGNLHKARKVAEVKDIVDKSRFHALLLICTAYCLCWIGYVQWQTTISSYTQTIGISLQQYSLLWALNGILIIVGQPLIRPFIRLIEDKIKTQIAVGIGIFIISFVVTSFAENFMMFVVGMVILTLGEMFVWPAVPTIANMLAPEGRVGTYQGIVNSTATLGRAIGPVAGGVIVDLFDMQMMFYAMIALLILSFVFVKIYDRKLT
ncbi:MFS transporter [Macrococcus hajekii]|uniref:MFS transporter n=1 Tax=Macrococcus hajekii TaxID=198482 RepID=A0A4R6BLY1_9STAP|nr:MFS transporter [Macrococcus hajekii]TDM02647.1 MFS transporter [Macrococcus hajekii]GGB02742.1 MFS transporter [Macrococcus hajekii]